MIDKLLYVIVELKIKYGVISYFKILINCLVLGYYDLDPKARYTEDSPSTGNDFLSQLCRDWESSATLPTTVSTRHVTVRIGQYYITQLLLYL